MIRARSLFSTCQSILINKLSLFNLFLSPKKLLLLIGIAFVTIASTPLKASAADRLKFNLGILSFELSIDALELYAKEGKIKRELNFYTSRLDERTVSQLRRVLRRKINIDPVLLYRLTRSSMIIELIESLGEVATTHHERNGFYASGLDSDDFVSATIYISSSNFF